MHSSAPPSTAHAAGAPTLADLTRDHGILYGGDYNPEQWPRETWAEDVRLMRAAGVNLVTVGVFSWAALEPEPGRHTFEWLDDVLDLLHGAGIAVDLATPTASPPPWLGHRHPGTLPVTQDGTRLGYGSRNQFCPSSRAYRTHALAITRAVVERYAAHPALRMWHVGNELGQVCHCDETAGELQTWLLRRYGSLEALNEAWATTVWSQRYAAWDEVLPPRAAPYHRNPSMLLDFRRFCSDQLREVYREQRDVVRERDGERPVTTNFMGFFPHVDYSSWSQDLDVVADDSYPDPGDPDAASSTALTQDLMRSLGGGAPWMLMEQATSGVSWRPHNLPKSAARMRRESLQAVARGADAICFFQWRQARSGPERFHSAMLPLAGPETALHESVRSLGADLRALRPVVGARVEADVAVVWDWSAWWAGTQEALPTDRLDPLETVRAWYRPLWRRGVAVDVVPPSADLRSYGVVLVPALPLLSEDDARNLVAFARAGGTLVVGPFTGVADGSAHLRSGRFPVLLRETLGVSGEEWVPVGPQGVDVVRGDGARTRAHTFAERVRSDGAEPVARFAGAGLDGGVAVSRHAVDRGTAGYVAGILADAELDRVLADVLVDTGVGGVLPTVPDGVEVVRRGRALFLLNHGVTDAALSWVEVGAAVRGPHPTTAPVVDLLTGEEPRLTGAAGAFVLPADGVAVLIERSS